MQFQNRDIFGIIEYIKSQILIKFNEIEMDFIIKSRMKQFFIEYDLIYSEIPTSFEEQFVEYMLIGSFSNQEHSKYQKNSKCKDINHLFYEGFGNIN